VWQQIFGVSLVSGRLLMALLGLLTAGGMYFVASTWWNSRAAGIAALVFGIVSTSPFFSYVMRVDALGILAYSGFLMVHIIAVKRDSPSWHFATGIAAVLTLEFHVLGLIYLGAVTVYYLADYAHTLVREKRIIFNAPVVYYGIGGIIASVIYAVIHILPDPGAYFVISTECFQCGGSSLGKELSRWNRFLIFRGLEVPVLLLVVIASAVRREREDWHFLAIFFGWIVVNALVGPPPFTHYTYHIWPLLALGVGGFVAHGFQRDGALRQWRVSTGLTFALVMLAVNYGFHLLGVQPFELRSDTEYADYTEGIAYIQQNIPTNTVIMSDVLLFHPLSDYTEFMSYRNGYEYGAGREGLPIIDYWREQSPLVILDNDWRNDDPDLDQYMTEVGFELVAPNTWVATELLDEAN
ncbi:MAG: glycosyltransferase family 39 protein, partial [Chloroflexota bacterium]